MTKTTTTGNRVIKSIVDSKNRTDDEKPPNGRIHTKILSSTVPSFRAKTLVSCQKKDDIKVRKVKKEFDESFKENSSRDLSASHVEVERLLSSRRQVNGSSVLTGSVIRTSSSLPRINKDIPLSKVISNPRDSLKTTTLLSTLRSSSPGLSVSSGSRTILEESLNKKKSITEFTEKLTADIPLTFICGDFDNRQKKVDKPRTIVRNLTKKLEICNSEERVKKNKSPPKKEKIRESPKTKNLLNGKKENDKKKVKKVVDKNAIGSTLISSSVTSVPNLEMERLKVTQTDSFFQNLFLRNVPSSTSSQCSTMRRSSVMERAQLFENDHHRSEPSLRSLNVYLAAKRPVSNSRFKNWEQESLPSRSSSPFGANLNGRSVFQHISKFDSLQVMDEYGSLTSLRGRSLELQKVGEKERSLSEPPLKMTLPSEDKNKKTSRSLSRSSSPSQTKPTSCKRIRSSRLNQHDYPSSKSRAKSASEADDCENKLFGSNLSLSKSTSSLGSPPVNRKDYQSYVYELMHSKVKSKKYKDLHDFYASLERMGKLERTASNNDLRPRLKNEEIIDYDRWKGLRSKERAEQELKLIYGKLKAVQREKDFLFSTKDPERFRWRGDCGLRCKDRSVENICQGFKKLEKEESKLESTRRREIESKKDSYKPLWRGSSVLNVASSMVKKANNDNRDENNKWSIQPSLQKSLGGSKKFWSSLSVEQVDALKNQLNEIYGSDNEKSKTFLPRSNDETLDKIEKHVEIHNKKGSNKYEVIVPPQIEHGDSSAESKGLSVRCHSMLVSDVQVSPNKISPLKRSGSISNGRLSTQFETDKSAKLTETEKKRLSLSLGKEILDKVAKRKRSPSPTLPRETPRATTTISSTWTRSKSPDVKSKPSEENYTLLVAESRTSSSTGKKKDIPSLEKALTISLSRRGSSTGESSENFVRTVVQQENEAEEVPKKIEFFETIERINNDIPFEKNKKPNLTSSQSVADLKELFGETQSERYMTLPFRSVHASRVCKDPSGNNTEVRGNGISASPDVLYGRLSSDLYMHYNRASSVSPCRVSTSTCSLDSPQHQSVSPDPERYYRAYLNLTHHGVVKKLREKFESLEDLSRESTNTESPTLKRFQSDPELTRNFLKTADNDKKINSKTEKLSDVAEIRQKYEPPRGRARKRGTGSPPIPRVPLRRVDLAMPHINIISKTIDLKDSAMSRSSSTNSLTIKAETEELEAKKPVEKIRKKFEKLDTTGGASILGEMFTSAPDVHELRDISPYLTGKWMAHKCPSRHANTRSTSLPPDLKNLQNQNDTIKPSVSTLPKCSDKVKKNRAASSSPVRSRTPMSILKQPHNDPFANQQFDPSKHRPKYRYQPPPPALPPPPPPLPPAASSTARTGNSAKRARWTPMPTYFARPTVTFEGPILDST